MFGVLLLWTSLVLVTGADVTLEVTDSTIDVPVMPGHSHQQGSPPYSVASEAVFGVTTRLHATFDPDGDRNYLVSPLSIAVLVGQLLIGAKGETAARLRDMLLGNMLEVSDARLHDELGGLFRNIQNNRTSGEGSYQLAAASAFFVEPNLSLNTDFKERVENIYAGDFIRTSFSKDPTGTLRTINEWGSSHTNGLIPTILERIIPSTAVVLANAIYFKADWLTPFSVELTIPGKFQKDANTEVAVQLMRGQFELKFVDSELFKCRMIRIPYKNDDVNMYIILPRRGVDIRELSLNLTKDNITALIGEAVDHTVTVVLPKMKLTTMHRLTEPLLKSIPAARSTRFTRRETPDSALTFPGQENDEVQAKQVNPGLQRLPLPLREAVAKILQLQQLVEPLLAQQHARRILPTVQQQSLIYQVKLLEQEPKYFLEVKKQQKMISLLQQLQQLLEDQRQVYEEQQRRQEQQQPNSSQHNQLPSSTPQNEPRPLPPNQSQQEFNQQPIKETVHQPQQTPEQKPSHEFVNEQASDVHHETSSTSTSQRPAQSTTTTKRPTTASRKKLDFGGASDDPQFSIDEISHHVSLEISETGTEAAVISSGSINYSGNVKVFKVDRPFLFFIRHEPSLVNLFWGVIKDPTNGELSAAA